MLDIGGVSSTVINIVLTNCYWNILHNPLYNCRYRFKKLPLGTRTQILILMTNPLTKNNKHDLVCFWTSCNSSQFDLHYTQIKPLRRLQGKNCWDGITRASRSVWTIWVAFIMLVEPWNRKGQQRGVLVHGCKKQDTSSFFQGLNFSLHVDDYIPSISWYGCAWVCTVQGFFETWFVQNSDNVVISWHVMCYIINREATKKSRTW